MRKKLLWTVMILSAAALTAAEPTDKTAAGRELDPIERIAATAMINQSFHPADGKKIMNYQAVYQTRIPGRPDLMEQKIIFIAPDKMRRELFHDGMLINVAVYDGKRPENYDLLGGQMQSNIDPLRLSVLAAEAKMRNVNIDFAQLVKDAKFYDLQGHWLVKGNLAGIAAAEFTVNKKNGEITSSTIYLPYAGSLAACRTKYRFYRRVNGVNIAFNTESEMLGMKAFSQLKEIKFNQKNLRIK